MGDLPSFFPPIPCFSLIDIFAHLFYNLLVDGRSSLLPSFYYPAMPAPSLFSSRTGLFLIVPQKQFPFVFYLVSSYIINPISSPQINCSSNFFLKQLLPSFRCFLSTLIAICMLLSSQAIFLPARTCPIRVIRGQVSLPLLQRGSLPPPGSSHFHVKKLARIHQYAV